MVKYITIALTLLITAPATAVRLDKPRETSFEGTRQIGNYFVTCADYYRIRYDASDNKWKFGQIPASPEVFEFFAKCRAHGMLPEE